MVQLFLNLLLNIINCFFSNTILKMDIYSTITDMLFVFLTISCKSNVSKMACVTIAVLNMHIMVVCKLFKAFLVMIVSSEIMLVTRCMYHSLEMWSTKIIVALSLFLVSFPLSCAMNPTCFDHLIMDTHLPGFLAL